MGEVEGRPDPLGVREISVTTPEPQAGKVEALASASTSCAEARRRELLRALWDPAPLRARARSAVTRDCQMSIGPPVAETGASVLGRGERLKSLAPRALD